eukprot:TRINITY_DN9498_c0_g1_i1.p2 TRINITY_DN9498_c0_g1~~TRINITY_DN9498_c0_g1_i1.p2  ORF type:complete len:231 (-),score=45.17 TRINITY_DN9498_c0_g1_i1:244-936(-)
MRTTLILVLVLLLSTRAHENLKNLFDESDVAGVDMVGLRNLRHRSKISYAALNGRAWDIAPIGSVGVLVKFGSTGSRDDHGRHVCVAVETSFTAAGIVCACSAGEKCLQVGWCSMQLPIEEALDAVRAAAGVKMADLFTVLSASSSERARKTGHAVLFGVATCLVRISDSSWPFATVRHTRKGRWVCFYCCMSDVDCEHTAAAAAAVRGEFDEDSDATDDESDAFGTPRV